MVGGYVSGLLSGILISIPAMINGELMSMPVFAAVGVLGGVLRDLAPEKEDLWRFSPFFDLSAVYRLLRQRPDLRRSVYQITCLLTVIFAELLRFSVARLFGARPVMVFALVQGHPGTLTVLATCASTLFAVALPLRIWNNIRNERKLEAQQLRLNEARLQALTSQINPHFLFNTVHSVSSLIRTNPEQARNVVYKLSSILRRLLLQTENFAPLREDLLFLDNYMPIQRVRF